MKALRRAVPAGCDAFASQLEGDPQVGLPPVLAPYVVERLLQPFEVVFV